MLYDGLLYHANKLCVSASSVRLLFLQEAYGGGLIRHFGVKKLRMCWPLTSFGQR
jgi:hypothetical protein